MRFWCIQTIGWRYIGALKTSKYKASGAIALGAKISQKNFSAYLTESGGNRIIGLSHLTFRKRKAA